jgi:dolichol-phosphate mannosyltransferase
MPVVDDSSPDGTADLVRSLRARFPRLGLLCRTEHRGFSASYLAGFHRAIGNPQTDAILMMDADLSHNPAYNPAMVRKLDTCDVVNG